MTQNAEILQGEQILLSHMTQMRHAMLKLAAASHQAIPHLEDSVLADLGFLMTRIEALSEAMAKECRGVLRALAFPTAERVVMAGITGDGDGVRLVGTLCSAKPRLTKAVSLPNPNQAPGLHAAACEYFGVVPSPLVRLHYPTIRETVTAKVEAGENIPEWLTVVDEASVTYTARGQGKKLK